MLCVYNMLTLFFGVRREEKRVGALGIIIQVPEIDRIGKIGSGSVHVSRKMIFSLVFVRFTRSFLRGHSKRGWMDELKSEG